MSEYGGKSLFVEEPVCGLAVLLALGLSQGNAGAGGVGSVLRVLGMSECGVEERVEMEVNFRLS